ncbi:MAG: SusD/RagB family nutrient-binding outer membrane lipoprotein [Agriterribacter sp.]
MKKLQYLRHYFISCAVASALLSGCTKNFESYNTDTNGVSDEQLMVDFNNIGAFFPSIENAFTANNMIPMDIGEFLTGGTFGGYFMFPNPGPNNTNYSMLEGWAGYGMFGVGYNAVMSPVNEIKRRGAETTAPDFWAIAQILKVYGMHKVTDIYGPVPYSKFGQGGTSVPYDSQEDIYNTFFTELDEATAALQDYISRFPGAKPFAKFDKVYGGDYTLWLRFANSLRLRLALQIVKVAPDEAKTQAEKAVNLGNGGVLVSNEQNAIAKEGTNALHIASQIWGDIRGNAALISCMAGYNDPRLPKYYDPSSVVPGSFVGIRTGSNITSRGDMLNYSNVAAGAFAQSSPTELMAAAEIYFLRAEGALRGWNMEGNAKDLYEAGISTSLAQWGVGGDAASYINDDAHTPADFVDPLLAGHNAPAVSDLTVKWDEAAGNEEKLERIIIQKWISDYPDGTVAWSTFRRTGYPKLFPVVVNNSGGNISSSIQIRRMNYPGSEYVTNAAEVEKGVTLLGGPDHGGTRLWWDVAGPNF